MCFLPLNSKLRKQNQKTINALIVIMRRNELIDKGANHSPGVSHFNWVLKDQKALTKAKVCKVKSHNQGHKRVEECWGDSKSSHTFELGCSDTKPYKMFGKLSMSAAKANRFLLNLKTCPSTSSPTQTTGIFFLIDVCFLQTPVKTLFIFYLSAQTTAL